MKIDTPSVFLKIFHKIFKINYLSHKKSDIMKKILFLFVFLTNSLLAQNAPKEVLLIGTFHFNNPGFDVAKVKTFNVMSDKSQAELETMSDKINAFNPDKIFVEWEYDNQRRLDSLYDLYVKNQYFDFVKKKYPKSTFYAQNEIFQLAFRTAKKANHPKVYAMDYPNTNFPYDSVMTVITQAKQLQLKQEIEDESKEFVKKTNDDFEKLNLTDNILGCNNDADRKSDIGWYISRMNIAGKTDNFIGLFLVSEWYKRNIYMLSIIQKLTASTDKKIMILAGSSHIAMMKEFLLLDKNYKIVELKEVLEKK
jgi:Family of unknown function (DUF5694)